MVTNIKTILLYVLAVILTVKTFSFHSFQKKDTTEIYYKKELKKVQNPADRAKLLYELGDFYASINKEDLAFKNFTYALKLFIDLNHIEKEMDCNLSIFTLLDSQSNIEIDALPYLDKYYKYAISTKNKKKELSALMEYASYNFNSINFKKSKSFYLKALSLSDNLKDSFTKAKINTNLGLLYSGYFKLQDSAKIFYENALNLYQPKHTTERYSTYLNYANAYQIEGKCKNAISLLKIADSIIPEKYTLVLQKNLYAKMANCYKTLSNYEKALIFLDKYNSIRDSINLTNQNIEISRVKEQFDNEKLRADNLESEANRKRNKNYLIASLFLLLFGGITAFLLQKNTKRKQLLAVQEKEIETQKLATVLKEQELTSIDAMIEGQEKERQRIANDLHDDLGGLMATVKLHFNALKDNKSSELFEKTNQLIDDAYEKVRSVAHAKNSGVIANQGLLKAIHEMAQKISDLKKTNIEVIDHGLENRLENSLELTIFRIIQELIANIIKHANASEATIHLTNHDDSLNIMVEDNGVGFNTNQITQKNKGMGISSIDKRIEHLNGKMTIESEPNKGTTIIIDIPL